MWTFHRNDKIIFISFLILFALSFLWMLTPLWIETNIIDGIKQGDHFRNHKTYTFLLKVIVIDCLIFNVYMSPVSGLYYYFFILKVFYMLMMDLVLFMRLINPNTINL